MRFASLGSGSAGNCMVVEEQQTRLMLDCGFNQKEVTSRLQRVGLEPAQISGILITHEHDDHAKGAFKFAAQHQIPVWLSYGTYKMCERYLPAQAKVSLNIIDSHTPFSIQDLTITPYPVPHDAREPTQFVFENGQHKLGVLTDAGSVTPCITQTLSGCDALVLECNHDLSMLENGPYGWPLKKRVGSRIGHLDNQTAAILLAGLDNSRLKHIIAAHLSRQNNTEALASTALSGVLNCAQDWVTVASQSHGFDWRSL